MASFSPRALFERRTEPLLRAGTGNLIALFAILTFLAALALGVVHGVRNAANTWRDAVAGEITIQIAAKEPGAAAERAVNLARATPGVRGARALTRAEVSKLLEPWLGANASLKDLPVPHLIVVELADRNADLATLRAALGAQVPGAILDDYRGWSGRLTAEAGTAAFAAGAILVLILAALALAAAIATRNAVVVNREVVDVLQFVGARDRFILRVFQRYFLEAGAKGAAIGAVAAILLLVLLARASPGFSLFAAPLAFGFLGYVQLLLLAVAITMLIALVSRFTVKGLLRRIA